MPWQPGAFCGYGTSAPAGCFEGLSQPHWSVVPLSSRSPDDSDRAAAPAALWPSGIEAAAAAALPDFLLRQRWYPAKDAGRPAVALARLLPFACSGLPAAVAVWEVTPPARPPFHMFVPLALVLPQAAQAGQVIATPPSDQQEEGARVVVEAFSVDAFVRAWLDFLLRGAAGGRLRAGRTQRLGDAGIDPGGIWMIRRSSAEQSNTSIRIGDSAILKVIRKLEEGVHPELEVGKFLTEKAGFAATPALFGWVELEGGAGAITLSLLQAFVPNRGDGWSWVLRQLSHVVAPQGGEARAESLAWLQRLGQRTAEMHKAFGGPTADPAFRSEPVRAEDLRAWTEAAQAMARRALDGLAAAGERLDPAARDMAVSLLARRELVSGRLQALTDHAPGFAKTRHHGDYHLGQVLVAGEDAVIIDFEGEPLRPLAERRAKHAPLRDVAGMLRSLAYAAATASRALPQTLSEAEREAALSCLAAWEAEAARVFREAYFSAAQGMRGLAADPAEAGRVLRFFMLEKALYEIAYELANRPDWVEIPLRGVLGLLENAPSAPCSSAAPKAKATRAHAMPFGADLRADGTVRFRLWAPPHDEIRLAIDGAAELQDMQALGAGWHELVTDLARAGTRYRFLLPDGLAVPDPASRHQPQDVHGPSEVVDPAAYAWQDAGWQGRPWDEAVLYELHVGAFTPAGTFRAAIDKLDHLVALGVTALELMPIGDFPGRRNWGYDGVLPYAPDAVYGRPEDLKALVDAAHARGLMILLDVVYNHFGPEGAYIHVIAPQTFTDRHKTPWGTAVNTDGVEAGPVREFFIHNALYWIEEFHFDGLRLDAVHAILDDSPRHLLEELAERVRAAAPDRHIHLVLENEENETARLARDAAGRPRWYTAQWNDDVHHVLHVAASGEDNGYYGDYKSDTWKLGRALAEGFAFQGEIMPYRGRRRGEPSAQLPPTAFVAFIQNHDQVGNRAFGDRLTMIAPPAAVRAVAATYLLLPQVPMLFMGEEWGAAQPFPFFCDFGPDLADAVRRGRRAEFARFPEFRDPTTRERIPDPLAGATFAAAKLAWNDVAHPPHAGWLHWYRRVLAVRHRDIVPRLAGIRAGGDFATLGSGAVVVRWALGAPGGELVLAANLSATPARGFPPVSGRVLWREGEVGDDGAFGPFAVRWSLTGPAAQERRLDDALDRLAERMGIEPEFRDARGRTVRAETGTKRRLLAAMGVDAADEVRAQDALDALERAQWLRPLLPVQVLRAEARPPTIDLVMPADTGEIAWELRQEDGARRAGRALFGRLDPVASRTLDGRLLERRRLVLEGDLPWGYHRLAVTPGDAETTLIVTPGSCWLPPAFAEGRRLWGIAAQLYLLRADSDWGIGGFGELRSLIDLAAAHGADVIGLNPLHALFPDDPEHASPYSPASRLLLNILNIDIAAVPELADSREAQELIGSADFRQSLAACRARHLVDYVRVAELKLRVLHMLFEAAQAAKGHARWGAFTAFRRAHGEVMECNCLFLALREHLSSRDPARSDWHAWPDEYRDPASPAVAHFAEQHRQRLDFLAWLQWLADEQLGAAAASAAAAGMTVGLYRDLAVGADRAGAETWANAAAVVSDATVGAPPDIYNPAGQNWGLPPFHPHALREEGYRSFVQLVRANMRHAGGLRIDHAMGLQHLYWVPQGESPAAGAYVRYPLDDLVGILALESHRHRCLVVGEDLGTVPEGFRERMAAANILSYRVLFFEQDQSGAFLPPNAYPALALAVVGSHDLPTLRGWWEERDLDLKERLGLFPGAAEAARQREMRRRDKAQLLAALRREELIPAPGAAPSTGSGPRGAGDGDPDIPQLARAVHAYLARTPCMLVMAQIDDLTDEADPVNIPATSDEHPNWRRRLSMTLEQLARRPRFIDVAEIFRTERGSPESPVPHGEAE
jgi:malto-oligosyltrehalose trehalohydrolase/4-alpha-glucanotransferase